MHAMFVYVTPEDPQFPSWWNFLGLVENDQVEATRTAQENMHGEDSVVSFEMPDKS